MRTFKLVDREGGNTNLLDAVTKKAAGLLEAVRKLPGYRAAVQLVRISNSDSYVVYRRAANNSGATYDRMGWVTAWEEK